MHPNPVCSTRRRDLARVTLIIFLLLGHTWQCPGLVLVLCSEGIPEGSWLWEFEPKWVDGWQLPEPVHCLARGLFLAHILSLYICRQLISLNLEAVWFVNGIRYCTELYYLAPVFPGFFWSVYEGCFWKRGAHCCMYAAQAFPGIPSPRPE